LDAAEVVAGRLVFDSRAPVMHPADCPDQFQVFRARRRHLFRARWQARFGSAREIAWDRSLARWSFRSRIVFGQPLEDAAIGDLVEGGALPGPRKLEETQVDRRLAVEIGRVDPKQPNRFVGGADERSTVTFVVPRRVISARKKLDQKRCVNELGFSTHGFHSLRRAELRSVPVCIQFVNQY